MANNATGGSGGSIHGESASLLEDDWSLDYLLQSHKDQGSEKNLQPQIDQSAGTGGFLPIWNTNQGVQAAAQTQPWSQQQVTDTNEISPESWTTKQGCQASAATPLLTERATSGIITHDRSAGNEEEWRARKRENDRKYRRRLKKERQDLENTLAATGKLCPRVEALEAEVRLLKEYVFGNRTLQPHRFNEMAQNKISTSREFDEAPALTHSQIPSSSAPKAQAQEKVLPQAPRRSIIQFRENRKQRERNAAPYNLGKTKKWPECNN